MLHTAFWVMSLLVAAMTAVPAIAADGAFNSAFKSPLDLPAVQSDLSMRVPFNGLARAGERLIAVGSRGYILHSDDGKTWIQAAVPVSSDLTAVYFASVRQGWAVGHEGVILHTSDGGSTWEKQLDGKQAAELILKKYSRPSNPDDPMAQQLKRDAEAMAGQGADKPFLDVWFENDQKGYAVGAFNLIFRTEDGGKSWQPWLDRIDNPRALHLYAIRKVGDKVLIAGEQGLLLKFDSATQRFVDFPQPYNGTLFGVTGNKKVILVYGLSGNAYRTIDDGAHWEKVETGVKAGLTSGFVGDDGMVVLVSQAGHVLLSANDGASFKRLKIEQPTPIFATIETGEQTVALAGIGGTRFQPLK